MGRESGGLRILGVCVFVVHCGAQGAKGTGVRHGYYSYHFCEILDQSEYERIVDH